MGMQATKVEKIVLDVLGQKLELTPEQAKELRDILVDVLGPKPDALSEIVARLKAKEAEKSTPFNPWAPFPWWYWETSPSPTTTRYEIVCKAGGF